MACQTSTKQASRPLAIPALRLADRRPWRTIPHVDDSTEYEVSGKDIDDY